MNLGFHNKFRLFWNGFLDDFKVFTIDIVCLELEFHEDISFYEGIRFHERFKLS